MSFHNPKRAAPPPDDSHPWRNYVIVLALMILAGMCLVSPTALEQLLLGWLYFPGRTLPQATVDRPTAVLGAVCAAAFVFGLHRTMRWLLSQMASKIAGIPDRWRFRSTLALSLGVILLFAAGTAMVGASHQIVWLITSDEQQTEGRRRSAAPVRGFILDARRAAFVSQRRNNLKSIGLAMGNVDDVYGSLPPGGTMNNRGRLLHGWPAFLCGYMSYTSAEIDFTVPWNEPPNARLFRCAVYEFVNPRIPEVFDDEGFGLSHVAGNVHVFPIVLVSQDRPTSPNEKASDAGDETGRPVGVRLDEITDGTTHTLLVGEVAERFKPWGHPANVRDPSLGINQSPDGFGGLPGDGGAQFVMCDGSVRFINEHVDPKVLRALSTSSGGEAVSEDDLHPEPFSGN